MPNLRSIQVAALKAQAEVEKTKIDAIVEKDEEAEDKKVVKKVINKKSNK